MPQRQRVAALVCEVPCSGKKKRLAIASYAAVSLPAARKARDAAKLRKAAGIDPLQPQKMGKLKASSTGGDTFKEIALPRRAKPLENWSPGRVDRTKGPLERDLFP